MIGHLTLSRPRSIQDLKKNDNAVQTFVYILYFYSNTHETFHEHRQHWGGGLTKIIVTIPLENVPSLKTVSLATVQNLHSILYLCMPRELKSL